MSVPGMGSKPVILNQPKPRPRTTRRIELLSCQVGVFCVLGEDDVCQGYKILIVDPQEATTYEMTIDDQEVWDSLLAGTNLFPKIGQKPESMDSAEEVQPDGPVI